MLPTPSGTAPREQLAALTSLRFAAASLIVVHHTHVPFGFGRGLAERIMLTQGVSFFFVLSGFILTHVYPTLDSGRVPRFLLARFARLWPLHLATFLATFLLFPPAERTPGHGLAGLTALVNLTLVQAWSARTEYYFSYNGPSWSISTEVTFYLLFPLLIRDWARTWPWKLALALACVAGVVAYCNHRDVLDLYVMVYMHPLARLFEFVLGMTTALAWRRVRSRVEVGTAAGTTIELAALGLVAWVMLNSLAWGQAARGWPLVGAGGGLWLANGGIPCCFFGVLIIVMALGQGLVSRALAARPMVLLGEISFSVYLIHHLLVRYYTLHRASFAAVPPWLAYVLFWATLLVASYLSWTALEQPCRRWLTGLAARRGADGGGSARAAA